MQLSDDHGSLEFPVIELEIDGRLSRSARLIINVRRVETVHVLVHVSAGQFDLSAAIGHTSLRYFVFFHRWFCGLISQAANVLDARLLLHINNPAQPAQTCEPTAKPHKLTTEQLSDLPPQVISSGLY